MQDDVPWQPPKITTSTLIVTALSSDPDDPRAEEREERNRTNLMYLLMAARLLLPPFSLDEVIVVCLAVHVIETDHDGLLEIGDLVNAVSGLSQNGLLAGTTDRAVTALLKKLDSLSCAEELALFTMLHELNG